ncbi:uncharacterized protein METZ01_LOCUS180472, partial [marine metagenome]
MREAGIAQNRHQTGTLTGQCHQFAHRSRSYFHSDYLSFEM